MLRKWDAAQAVATYCLARLDGSLDYIEMYFVNLRRNLAEMGNPLL